MAHGAACKQTHIRSGGNRMEIIWDFPVMWSFVETDQQPLTTPAGGWKQSLPASGVVRTACSSFLSGEVRLLRLLLLLNNSQTRSQFPRSEVRHRLPKSPVVSVKQLTCNLFQVSQWRILGKGWVRMTRADGKYINTHTHTHRVILLLWQQRSDRRANDG